MITDIEISDNPEKVYNLKSIGIEGELVVTSENTSYILTDTDYFPVIKDFKNFKEIGNKIILEVDMTLFIIPIIFMSLSHLNGHYGLTILPCAIALIILSRYLIRCSCMLTFLCSTGCICSSVLLKSQPQVSHNFAVGALLDLHYGHRLITNLVIFSSDFKPFARKIASLS